MSRKYLLNKVLATSLVASLGTSFAALGTPAAHAATATQAVNLSCRTNGAPMGYNVTREMKANVALTTPTHVPAGENAVIRVEFLPEETPGKESVATVKRMEDIVLRFTLDDPTAFVTAKTVSPGKAMEKPATVSLVGGNMLVLSGMNVAVNGNNTSWAPPAVEITMKAPAKGDILKTVHLAVEGPAGEFNNPANALTMKSITESRLGHTTVQMNCQAKSGATTFATVPIVGSTPSSASKHPKSTKSTTPSTKEGKGITGNDKGGDGPQTGHPGSGSADGSTAPGGFSDTNTVTTDANGLQRVDDDIYAAQSEKSGTPLWGKVLLSVICLGAVGAIGYRIYGTVKNKKR